MFHFIIIFKGWPTIAAIAWQGGQPSEHSADKALRRYGRHRYSASLVFHRRTRFDENHDNSSTSCQPHDTGHCGVRTAPSASSFFHQKVKPQFRTDFYLHLPQQRTSDPWARKSAMGVSPRHERFSPITGRQSQTPVPLLYVSPSSEIRSLF